MLGELQVQQRVTLVVLHGELDLVTVDSLRAMLDQAIDCNPSRLVVDLSDVPFVDVLSLAAILAAADSVRDRGGVAVVRGATPAVRRVCSLLNAGDVLDIDLPQPRRCSP